MDLGYSKNDMAFVEEVQTFLDEAWKNRLPAKGRPDAGLVREFRLLATELGYLYRSIPKAYGGSEQPADPMRGRIIRECFEKARAPMEVPGAGMSMLIPTLLEHGTEEQRQWFIPKTILGEYRWAQGYSEPGAGSDLASLKTNGRLEDGQWIINGQKIWTSQAYSATHMFALVRTEPDAGKHAGISYLLLELDQPGISIRTIHQITGQSEFCEVFFEDARTPADWIVGGRGSGWQISKTTLKHERSNIGGVRTLGLLESLWRLARNVEIDGRPAAEDPQIRDRMMVLEGYVQAQLCCGYYQFAQAVAGGSAGRLPLLNKIAGTRIALEIAQVAQDIIGDRALELANHGETTRRDPGQWVNQIFGSLALSIAGGASNIQRNIIAERGLGLPKDEAI
ncbi:acyl-CoA dehydrogenase [Rhizorhabdus dicambivorans]|uniref:Acyl-CoA dehydrogenase n=2 Tax=Rhizorhabdus dicambivorans TaxID=1850238 RepID=A0A2A4FXS2_9SPHN|nr:acyl-CoA dehydrogenase [Rhizorhabdus dicambivorans]PCE42502.1 acyl-CoA dehydrogenase [Rhizorhabdus dicambivorans]